MPEYELKPGKIGKAAIDAYKKVEEKFTDAFLEKDPEGKELPTLKVGKLGQTAMNTYQKIEDTVVGEYKRVENAFVNAFLTEKKPEGQEAAADSDAADEAGADGETKEGKTE